MMPPPKRRYEVDMKINADNLESVISALRAILFNLQAYKVEDEEINIVSGGWDSGYSITGHVDTTITGDSYRDALNLYMSDPGRHHKQEHVEK